MVMNKIGIEKVFIVLGLIFGALFIILIPPFQSPDEDSHFKKAYSISEFEPYIKKVDDKLGFNIPNEMNSYINDKLTKMGDFEYKYSYGDMYKDQLLPNNLKDTSILSYSTYAITPIAHLIPSLGIILSKIISPLFIDGSPSTAFMLSFARIFSLIGYLIMGYFAIKITPIYKKSMCAILLLPMSLFLGSMVSYDGLLLGATALSVAFILKLIYEKKFEFDWKMLILFSVMGYILLNIKTVYFPILLLLLFVPKNKFSNEKKWKTYLILIGIILLSTMLLKIPNFINSTETSSDVSLQIKYILSHPISYTGIMLKNIIKQFGFQLYGMIGNFGLLDTYLPPVFIIITLVNLVLTFISDGICEKIHINYKMKLFILCYIIGVVALIYSALYVTWTSVTTGIIGGEEITGVQGRYFIPLLIVLPLLFSNNLFKNKSKIYNMSSNYFSKSIVAIIVILVISILTCLTRFWI